MHYEVAVVTKREPTMNDAGFSEMVPKVLAGNRVSIKIRPNPPAVSSVPVCRIVGS